MKVVNNRLYTTHYVWSPSYGAQIQYPTARYYLDEVDLTDRAHPKFKASINVPGILGWGNAVDYFDVHIYRVSPTTTPTYDQFVRTQGWGVSSIARQGNTLFLSAGDWGVQVVPLQ
jgi:hypothetical protein